MAATSKKPSNRVPATLVPSRASHIKLLFRKRGGGLSLKQWLRSPSAPADPEFQEAARGWLHNKRANTRSPELCIGKTRRKKGGNDRKKDAAPAAGKR